MTMNLEPTASSSSYEDDSSSSEEETDSPVLKASLPVTTANSSSEEEEETDSESETEPVPDSKDGSKPQITANSLSDSPVVKPDSSNKVEAPMNTANSSSEEEEEETDSESETEQEEVEAVKPPADSSSKVPVTTANSSSEEEEEETDSESETDPVETSSKPETTEVEPDSPAVKPPTDSNKVETSQNPFVTKKRPIDETMDERGEAKRIKTVSGGDDDDKKITVFQETKKNYFQRVWTEEDEITVLQGIIDYQNETGSNPFDDKNALYELLKQSLSFTPTKTQFSEKIRSLKKKFDNNREKEKKRGEAPAFSKPHDLETFRLSKFVWGGDGIMSNAIEVKPPVLKLVDPPAAVKKQEFGVSIVDSLARFGVDNLFAKKGWSKLSLEDKKRLEVEWEALQLEELRFYSRKSRFIHDALAKMAEASQHDH